MIIKTLRPHADGRRLGRYLTKDSKDNERIEERGTRGTFATDTVGALREMAASRHGARCQQPLYHVVFNAARNEHLSPEQWDRALDLWEREMGLGDRQRAIVQHHKDGRWHTHVVYNRIDMETGKAVNIGRDHFAAKRVARQIEMELGLEKVPNKRAGARRERQPPHRWETEQTRRTKANADEVRELIAQAWALSDTGRAFQNALEAEGLTLAQGDRRPFLVIDKDDNLFALGARLLPHTRMKDIHAKMADIDASQLPSVPATRKEHKRKEKPRKKKEPASESGDRSSKAAADETPTDAVDEIHEKHRRAHVDLTARAKEIEQDHERIAQELAKAHERERQQLAEKHRDRWWHKIIRKSQKVRDRETAQREQQAALHGQETAALDLRQQQELADIEAQRAKLREEEKIQRALVREFNRQQGRQVRAGLTSDFEKSKERQRPAVERTTGERQRSAEQEADRQRMREEIERQRREKELERQGRRDRGRGYGDD